MKSLDGFFSSHPSAKMVGGERHSTRIRKPSKRTTDPDNAEAADGAVEDAASGRKRKAMISSVSRRVTCKVIESDSDESASGDAGPDGDETEDDSDNEEDDALADAKYDRLKSFGDKDREVLTSLY
jgi:hypothetical protein